MQTNRGKYWEGKGRVAGDGDGDGSLLDNFGSWTFVDDRTPYFFSDTDTELKFKADMQAFANRAIVYVRGQFGLLDTFAGATITLGNLPLNTRPKAQLKKFMICQDIELFLVIETNGDVKLISKDTDNFALPTGSGDLEEQPYYVDCFYDPLIPMIYTAHREGNFTRNNCADGFTGTAVHFSHDYTSDVDQATADALADANFNADGQAYANDPANGATCEVSRWTAHREADFIRNNCADGFTGTSVHFAKDYTSNVSQAAANALADANFAADGQAYANDPANGATCEVSRWTAHREADFTRNNCADGFAGTSVHFAKDYISNVSQAAADALADANFNADGQAYANDPANGATCEVSRWTAHREADFTRNNCGDGFTGTSVHFAKDYTSNVSQAAADALADANFNADGQAYANDPANGATCEVNSVELTMGGHYNGDGTATIFANISAPLLVDLEAGFSSFYIQAGVSQVGPGDHIMILAGEEHGEAIFDVIIDDTAGPVDEYHLTILFAAPNPAGGVTITF